MQRTARTHFLEHNEVPLIDETFTEVTPSLFKSDVDLYKHQRILISQLMDWENNRKSNNVFLPEVVLSEKLGSGKTFVLLGLIMANPIPHSIGEIYVKDDYKCVVQRAGATSAIRPTMIVVGGNVVKQWENTISQFTTLSYFSCHDFLSFRNLLVERNKNPSLSKYNIILVKSGMITSAKLKDIFKSDEDTMHMLIALELSTKNSTWSRVIIDDYDTINLAGQIPLPKALSHIFVTATGNNITCDGKSVFSSHPYKKDENIIHPIHVMSPKGNMVVRLKCCDKFIKKCLEIPLIVMHKYIYDNPHDTMMEKIKKMGMTNQALLNEIVNGDVADALTFQRLLGNNIKSVADVLTNICGDKIHKLKEVLSLKKWVGHYLDVTLEALPWNDPEQRAFHFREEEVVNALRHKTEPNVHEKDENYVDVCYNTYDKIDAESAQCSRNVEAMRENLRNGNCQVCKVDIADLVDKTVCVNTCCSAVLCNACVIRGNRFRGAGRDVTGKCPNCSRKIQYGRDTLFITDNIDIDMLKGPLDNDMFEVAPVEVDVAQEESEDTSKMCPKHKAILEIIKGNTPANAKKVQREFTSVMKGEANKPVPRHVPRKVLIFASLRETFMSLARFLDSHGIRHLELTGTPSHINNVLNEFENDVNVKVLMINSNVSCAGLNLQRVSTDLVFYHVNNNKNIEEQIIGRMVRIGREYNCNIHWLVYKNESVIEE